MHRLFAVLGGGILGVAVMLGILQPWKKPPRSAPPARPLPFTSVEWQAIAQAKGLIENGEFERARKVLSDQLASTPTLADAHAYLALIDIRTADPNSAQMRLAQAAAIEPMLFEIPLFQGHLEMLTRDYRAAIRSYTEAVKRNSKDGRAQAGRAAARFELKEFAGALEDANEAIGWGEWETLFTRAAAYSALGRYEESLRDWTHYLGRNKTDAHAWMNRGNAHERTGRKAAAVADWKEAVKLDPRLAEQLEPLINASN